jgi:quinol monooxygenase YgiN
MVTIYGGVAVAPMEVAAVTEAACGFQAKCRAEQGCLDYTLAWEVAEPNRLRLLEAWADEGAYHRHVEQSHVQDWKAFIESVAVEPAVFTRNVTPGP